MRHNSLKKSTVTEPPSGDHHSAENFQTNELPGAYYRPKNNSTITGRLITKV